MIPKILDDNLIYILSNCHAADNKVDVLQFGLISIPEERILRINNNIMNFDPNDNNNKEDPDTLHFFN